METYLCRRQDVNCVCEKEESIDDGGQHQRQREVVHHSGRPVWGDGPSVRDCRRLVPLTAEAPSSQTTTDGCPSRRGVRVSSRADRPSDVRRET